MKKPSTYCFVLATVLLANMHAVAQQAKLDTLLQRFDRYRIDAAQEKLYAHLDQDFYLTGETMWFNLYVTDASLHKPNDLSKVAYLEVLDNANQAVLQTKVALKNGTGHGSLFLPANIAGGSYTVRAYTRWMKNAGPEYFYHHDITIINPFKKLELDKSKTAAPLTIQFFPEGGDLVNGLTSTVAYKITSQGKPITAKGTLTNSSGDTIARINPQHAGMGRFELTPREGTTFQVSLRDSTGRTSVTTLPAARNEGFVMHVKDSTDALLAIHIRTKLTTAPSTPAVYVFAHARNIIVHAAIHYLQQGQTVAVIPKQALQPGITHITVFDANLVPRCERLYFTTPDKKITIAPAVSQAQFGIRRKVAIDITTQAQQKNIAAKLSVAVYKADSLQTKNDGDIYSYLWFTSDLKGDVETPEFYLSNNPEARVAADNLMLTQGWRRFTWTDLLNQPKPTVSFMRELHGPIITGRVRDKDGQQVQGLTTYLAFPGKKVQLFGSTSDAQGKLYYEMHDFIGPKKLVVQTNQEKDSVSVFRIEIDNPFADKFSARHRPPFQFPVSLQKELMARSVGMQVQDIFYQDKSEQIANAVQDSSSFYYKPDATYFLDKFTRFTVMEEVMREYVPGVLVRKRRDGFHYIVLDNVHKGVFAQDPMILLDGVPVFDADRVMEFDPLKVQRLDVIQRRYYLGNLSLPGVVSYTTYTGDLAGFVLDPRSLVMDYEGLQLQREFYMPAYETQRQRESRLPDQRSLLYWAPDVTTDATGKTHLEFFTSDVEGTYTIAVQGLTREGDAGSAYYTFTVKAFDH